MTEKELKEYNKTWYWKITRKTTPENWIVGTPKRLFSKYLFTIWKVAKSNYKWNKF